MVNVGARIGVAAFALGVSVLGPQCLGVASADSGPDTQTSTSSATRAHRDAVRSARTAAATPSAAASRRSTAKSAAAAAVSPARATRSADAAASEVVPRALRRASAPASTPVAGQSVSVNPAAPAPEEEEETPIEGPTGRQGTPEPESPSVVQKIDAKIYGALDNVANLLADLRQNALTELLQGGLLLVRRTLFDQAPTVNPQQTSGQSSGAINGTVGAYDPEQDRLYYRIVLGPQDGTVGLNPDGTFLYVPGPSFTGRDVFIVAASDRKSDLPVALWGNILQPFRPTSTQDIVIVEQGDKPQVTYSFTYLQTRYGLDVGRWTPNGKVNMEWAAYVLADKVAPKKDITLTYTATAEKDRGRESNLASAGSYYTNVKDPGFFPTVVQSKIQTGSATIIDPEKQKTDGYVTVNFGRRWGYGGVVTRRQFDYAPVLMHEFLHSYGFAGSINGPDTGCNVYNCGDNGKPIDPLTPRTNWVTYDKFVSNEQGVRAINANIWNTDFNTNLTGGNGGLYFSGTNADEAFKGPVPLFTPEKFKQSSSVSHTDDFYFDNKTDPSSKQYIQLMNAGEGPGIQVPKYLSPWELGILQDIDYTLSTPV